MRQVVGYERWFLFLLFLRETIIPAEFTRSLVLGIITHSYYYNLEFDYQRGNHVPPTGCGKLGCSSIDGTTRFYHQM